MFMFSFSKIACAIGYLFRRYNMQLAREVVAPLCALNRYHVMWVIVSASPHPSLGCEEGKWSFLLLGVLQEKHTLKWEVSCSQRVYEEACELIPRLTDWISSARKGIGWKTLKSGLSVRQHQFFWESGWGTKYKLSRHMARPHRPVTP